MKTTFWCYFCKPCDNHFGCALSAEAAEALPGRLTCPRCGTVARKLKEARVDRHLAGGRMADFPAYWSESMGVGPGERGLPGETYNADGDLLVEGRRHRRELMRTLNYKDNT